MPRAKLEVEIPEGIWVRDVSTAHPDAVFRVLSALAGDDYGVGIIEIEGNDALTDILEEMDEHPTLADTEVLWENGEEALLQIRTHTPLILREAYSSGVPVEMPFEITDGTGTWELTVQRENLSRLSEKFDSAGIHHRIEYVRDLESEKVLTEKQREVAEKAREMGYYDTPREASLSEVADELGVAKSTCSEILHRAEEKVMKKFLG
ncbi:MAG: helix-turn-helix domain-containing protein [Halobacteriales archaeon]|nr:helix-turn-helix domain-containing protein [Halobacteriales archaeon]